MTGLRAEHLLCTRGKQLVFSTSGFILATISCFIIGIGLLYVGQPHFAYEYITSSAYALSIWRPALTPPDASPKLILLHSDWYGHEVLFPGFGFEHCREKNCVLSTNVEADFNRSDAVWFHSAWTLDALPPYPRPSPAQIWINSEVEALGKASERSTFQSRLDNRLPVGSFSVRRQKLTFALSHSQVMGASCQK